MNTPNQDLPLLPAPLPTDAPPNTDNNSTVPQAKRTNNDSTDKKRKREMVPNNNDPPRFAATGGITLPLPLPPAKNLGEIVEKTVLPPEPPPVKINCSVLAEDAIKAAIKDYQEKNGFAG